MTVSDSKVSIDYFFFEESFIIMCYPPVSMSIDHLLITVTRRSMGVYVGLGTKASNKFLCMYGNQKIMIT